MVKPTLRPNGPRGYKPSFATNKGIKVAAYWYKTALRCSDRLIVITRAFFNSRVKRHYLGVDKERPRQSGLAQVKENACVLSYLDY